VSKKKSRDKIWITLALKRSCHKKNSLYRRWTRNRDNEIKYKEYRKTFRKVMKEAKCEYYKEQYDLRKYSMKQICVLGSRKAEGKRPGGGND